MLALDMHRAAAGRGAGVEGRRGMACNVNGNCVAAAGQHRQTVSQSGSPITYIHTHTLTFCACQCMCVCALNSLWRRHRQQRQTTTIDTTTRITTTTNERPQFSASVAAAAALSVVIGAVATLFINCQAHIAPAVPLPTPAVPSLHHSHICALLLPFQFALPVSSPSSLSSSSCPFP